MSSAAARRRTFTQHLDRCAQTWHGASKLAQIPLRFFQECRDQKHYVQCILTAVRLAHFDFLAELASRVEHVRAAVLETLASHHAHDALRRVTERIEPTEEECLKMLGCALRKTSRFVPSRSPTERFLAERVRPDRFEAWLRSADSAVTAEMVYRANRLGLRNHNDETPEIPRQSEITLFHMLEWEPRALLEVRKEDARPEMFGRVLERVAMNRSTEDIVEHLVRLGAKSTQTFTNVMSEACVRALVRSKFTINVVTVDAWMVAVRAGVSYRVLQHTTFGRSQDVLLKSVQRQQEDAMRLHNLLSNRFGRDMAWSIQKYAYQWPIVGHDRS